MLTPLNMWNKIGRIIYMTSEKLGISIAQATDIFYRSRTCANLHNPDTGLYLMGDIYIFDDLMAEL